MGVRTWGGRVALAGFGTVGRSVARILSEAPPAGLRLTHILNRNVQRKRADWVPGEVVWTERIEDVLESDADVLVELIGGLHPAEDWIRGAMERGKSVVTANKQLIALRGPELFELARRRGVQIGFEASVAGGIPIISGLRDGLSGDSIFRISGILNGTCNYILTRMQGGDLPFATALREAQELGYAESDPAADIDGLDARAKLAILASVGLRAPVHPEEIACRSISVIEAIDFAYASKLASTIRQVSRAERGPRGGALFAAVQPALVPLSSPLAQIEGSRNLVMTTGRYGAETVFAGHGAGGDPTAVAVVSDLVAVGRGGRRPDVFPLSGGGTAANGGAVVGEFAAPHYVRFTVRDRPGIIAALAAVLARYGINIDAVMQEPGSDKAKLPFVITLEECSNSALDSALREIHALDFHVQPPVSLPILG